MMRPARPRSNQVGILPEQTVERGGVASHDRVDGSFELCHRRPRILQRLSGTRQTDPSSRSAVSRQ